MIIFRIKQFFYEVWLFIKYLPQRIFWGFTDADLWNLDHTIAKFILPRLKRFRKKADYWIPASLEEQEEWDDILDKMLFSFNLIIKPSEFMDIEDQDKIINEGLDLFRKYFFNLWN